jgi:hypothetical protein
VNLYPRPLRLEAGDGFRWTCRYRNAGTDVLRFGVTSNDEMCFTVGFFYPDDDAAPLPVFADASGTGKGSCARCSSALLRAVSAGAGGVLRAAPRARRSAPRFGAAAAFDACKSLRGGPRPPPRSPREPLPARAIRFAFLESSASALRPPPR